jgi:hemoglobin
MKQSQRDLLQVLQEARSLLARPGNDFAWSSWSDPEAALRQIDELIAVIEEGQLPDRSELALLFAPTGPLQEVSLNSGWGCEFLDVARRFDSAVDRAYQDSPPATSSLYERLGGVYAIAAVVDDFIDRIMDDPRLNANPKVDEAHHRVSRAGFKYLVTEMVCWATGGPQRYTGRSMVESHAHLEITEDEWQVFLDDFRATLDRFEVPGGEQQELFAIVHSTKSDIVRPASTA